MPGTVTSCHMKHSSWFYTLSFGFYTLQVAESPDQAAERHLGRSCVGAFQSAEWALVKWLKGTDEVVDQALNDQKSRK